MFSDRTLDLVFVACSRHCVPLSNRRDPVGLVVIDSPSPYLCRHTVSTLCRELRSLLDDGLVASVAVGFHRDLASAETMAALRSVCSALLEVRPPGPPPRSPVGATCRLELCRASGKVVVEVLGMAVVDHFVTLTHTGGAGEDQESAREIDKSTTTSASSSSSSVVAQKRDAPPPASASSSSTRPYTLTEAEQLDILKGSGSGRIL